MGEEAHTQTTAGHLLVGALFFLTERTFRLPHGRASLPDDVTQMTWPENRSLLAAETVYKQGALWLSDSSSPVSYPAVFSHST